MNGVEKIIEQQSRFTTKNPLRNLKEIEFLSEVSGFVYHVLYVNYSSGMDGKTQFSFQLQDINRTCLDLDIYQQEMRIL